MSARPGRLLHDLVSGTEADRIVPPTGIAAQLTVFVAGAMAFLTVFALALLVATDRLADRWSAPGMMAVMASRTSAGMVVTRVGRPAVVRSRTHSSICRRCSPSSPPRSGASASPGVSWPARR